MSLRFYIVPENRATPDTRDPKYVATDAALAGLVWNAMDYGIEPVFIIGADVTPAQHAALSAYSDVISLPANIDAAIGSDAVLAQVKAGMETLFIPADWVTTGTTWRQVIAAVLRMAQFMQRLHGLYGLQLSSGRNLDIKMSAVPAGIRTQMQTAAQSFGWDTGAIKLNWSLRQVLIWVAAQWTGPVYFAGQVW